jgi:hypothetical protein
MNQNDEMIYNWSNALRKTSDGVLLVAIKTAEKLKEENYSVGDASDILVAADYDLKIVDAAIKNVYSEEEEDEEEQKGVAAFVVPTSYEDVKPLVEKSLVESSARDFMEKLARSAYPIIPNLPDNKFESFIRVAARAKEDENALVILHKDLLPFIESAMYESVKIAEKKQSKANVSSTGDESRYVVAYSIGEVNDISVESGECNCDKYIKGNYHDFGLACEHLVSATNIISPGYKLVRG